MFIDIKSISCEELFQILNDGNFIVIDTRDKDSYRQSHIPGAISVNGEHEVNKFLKETDKAQKVVCCCYRGNSSRNVVAYLQNQGFKNVYNLTGGFEAWSAYVQTDK